MREWSTDAVRAHERFSYWREAICQSILNLGIEAPAGSFSARLSARSAGAVRIAVGESTRYQLTRGAREAANDTAVLCSIYLQLRGQVEIAQGAETFTLAPNDVGITDLQRPLRWAHADGGRRITIVAPRDMLERRAPWLRKTPILRLPAVAPYVDLARRHMLALAGSPAMSESTTALMIENLCNLLALASASDLPPSRLQPELQIEAMLAFCRQHLHETELKPQRVADRLGVSLRTLHTRFKAVGSTFGQWVLEERLKACAVSLRDDSQRGLKISDIAFRWGFNDLSHFNKSFRARFGQTPAEWRRRPEI
jgi:AraC-like DNA-binding protein